MNTTKKITILQEPSEKNPFVIIYKPSGMPTAPLSVGEYSALTQTVECFPAIKKVIGRKIIEYGLLHRIETETAGIILIAATQSAYDSIAQAQADGLFVKEYAAECNLAFSNKLIGFCESPYSPQTVQVCISNCKSINVISSFRYYGLHHSAVRPVVAQDSNTAALKKVEKGLYETEITFLPNKVTADSSLPISVDCKIKKGFKHQVRCHLAWIGVPVKGDKVYNSQCTEREQFCFKAVSFSFPHPLTHKTVYFELPSDLN